MKSNVYRLLAVSTVILSTVLTGFSATTFWIGDVGHVDDPANWAPGFPDNTNTIGVATNGELIGSGDDFSSKSIDLTGTAGINITNDLTVTDARITLVGNTGMLANGDIDITLGSGGSNPDFAVISLYDASLLLLTAGDLTLGGDSDGGIFQPGGVVQLPNGLLRLGSLTGSGVGLYDLEGGTARVNDIVFTTISSYIDLSSTGSGVLEVSASNYSISDAEANISNGNIRRDGVVETDLSLYSITNEGGFIKVQAIPEPAVIGLIGIGGLGMLVSRRLSKKLKAE